MCLFLWLCSPSQLSAPNSSALWSKKKTKVALIIYASAQKLRLQLGWGGGVRYWKRPEEKQCINFKLFSTLLKFSLDKKQDGRLAPAYFLPNYKYFNQHLPIVKNKTTVLILVFKEFLQINSTTDFCTWCKRLSRFSLEKFSSHSAEKFRRATLVFHKISGIEKIYG